MTSRYLLAVLPAALVLSAPAHAQAVGEWVLAPWQDSTMDFPGTVVARSEQSVTIQFDDGTRETRHVSEVRPFDWKRGSAISCRWTDGYWYLATVTRMDKNGYTLQVRYDEDGVIEETNTGKCRSR